MIEPNKFYDWKYLSSGGKNILNDLLKEWITKLEDKTLSENDYHSFLAEHAGFFFDTQLKSLQTISKLLLGSDFETDFVVIHEGFSEGIIYELIEIESPHKTVYTKNGQPSAHLIAAIQQIENWKRLLLEHRVLFTRMFPNFHSRIIRDSNLRFTIITGRRVAVEKFAEDRNDYGEKLKIQIRSFDYLTENLKRKMKLTFDSPMIFSSEMDKLPKLVRNRLANPFYRATSDAEWKSMCSEIKANHHYFAQNHAIVLKYRNYNNLLDKFILQYEANKIVPQD